MMKKPKYDIEVGDKERLLELGTNVRYLLEPAEGKSEKRRRVTDPKWSLAVRKIVRIMAMKDQPVRFFLNDVKRSFVRKEFQNA